MTDIHFSWNEKSSTASSIDTDSDRIDDEKWIETQIRKIQNRQLGSPLELFNLMDLWNLKGKDKVILNDIFIDTQFRKVIPLFDSSVLMELITKPGDGTTSDDYYSIKTRLSENLYDIFFDGPGCFILKNAYPVALMEDFNFWCEQMIAGKECEGDKGSVNSQNVSKDKNFIHPTQKGKYLINDVLSRLASTNPSLLYQLLYDSNGAYVIHWLIDVLLGFGKIGAAAAHWITPNSNTRQFSHVDFPLNINSSPFWGMCVEKMKKITTKKQLNDFLPHYSCQALIATDPMDEKNGSTEVIPCSQVIPNVDLAISKGSKFYEGLEKAGMFVNVELDQGDVLIFNRRLIHRGGANQSDRRRNALIMQYVWLWGVGQEILDIDTIVPKLIEVHENIKKEDREKQKQYREDFKGFIARINPPYPKDTRLGT